MNLQEANRQLQLAVHDAQVAYDCVELGEIDRAHTHALMARTAADAAETALRYALAEERGEDPPSASEVFSVEQENLR
jgi:hypothetical protein